MTDSIKLTSKKSEVLQLKNDCGLFNFVIKTIRDNTLSRPNVKRKRQN